MKIKLQLLLLAISFAGYSQPVIQSFYGGNMPVNYMILQEITDFDQSPSGTNVTWTFPNYDEIGTNYISFPSLSDLEINTFPNSTNKIDLHAITNESEANLSEIFALQWGNSISLTGFTTPGLTINYIQDNAKIGDYPMTFGYSNTDTSAGTYDYGDYSGTFTGIITTQADAYGNLLIGNDPSVLVSRTKTVQNLSMNYNFFNNVGTFTQTIFNYYAENSVNGEPILRTTTTTINVPLLGINETSNSFEVRPMSLLGATDNDLLSTKISIVPNPVNDILHFEIASDQKLQSVVISDINGKSVFTSLENNADVSALSKGIYFAKITTDAGSVIKKMIRN